MSVAAGSRLGPYEIVAPLGAGGMGEVYRARDTKLDRDVALKILPEPFALDAERVARFAREAKTLAALNHPHIAQIHGLEETNGVSALVMELVDGETLADRIARAPLPIDDALPIARQIADALEAAHEHGIVHRDLKPANIKVRDDGTVKVLDFGLAKALDPRSASLPGERPDAVTNSPTITSPAAMTGAGVILGTAAYMAPEQAKGRAVDKRADIWAFGCVLFEMLTGRRAFLGDDVSDTLASVLKDQPDWAKLPPATPMGVRRLLHRCVEKDPRRRLRDIGEAWLLLDDLIEGRADRSEESPKTTARWRSVLMTVSTGIVLVSAAGAYFGRSPRPAVQHLDIALPPGDSLEIRYGSSVAISPDGRQIVYKATRGGHAHLFRRSIDAFDPVLLAGTQDAVGPTFSPDGRWLAFFAGGKLQKLDTSGTEPPAAICDCVAGAEARVSWSDTDTIVYDGPTGLFVVPGAGGPPRQLTTHSRAASHSAPHWLPGGHAILVATSTTDPGERRRIEAITVETGARKTLLEGEEPEYVGSGHIVFARDNNVFAVRFDPRSLSITGAPVLVLTGLSRSTRGDSHLSVSQTGTLVYVPGPRGVDTRALALVDRQGAVEHLDVPLRGYVRPRVSSDGRRVVVESIDTVPHATWIFDVGRRVLNKLAEGRHNPTWMPDSQHVLFSDGSTLFRQAADGDAAETEIATIDVLRGRTSAGGTVSPDGRMYAFSTDVAGHGSDIFALELGATSKARPVVQTRYNERSPAFSPDGRWLAYVSDELGQDEIYVQPFPGPGAKTRVSDGGGTEPVWSHDSREIFFRQQDRILAATTGLPRALAPARPVTLFSGTFDSQPLTPAYDVTPNGRFVMVQGVDERRLTHLRVVLNWSEELRARVSDGK